MAQDFCASPPDDRAYRDGRDPMDAVPYGYMTYGIPLSRNNGFYTAMGISLPDRTTGFPAWADQESYGPTPPMLPCYQQPVAFTATQNPLDQLVPENLRILDQNLSIVSGQPTAVPSEPSITPMNASFVNPMASPEMYYHPFDSLVNTAYIDGDVVVPCLETVTSIVIPAREAITPSSPSTSSTAWAHVPPVWGHSESELTSPSAENDPATDSLPLCRLSYGAWKCMLCGQELRRKQRAVVHYWSKHGNVRLSCSGRCGSIDW